MLSGVDFLLVFIVWSSLPKPTAWCSIGYILIACRGFFIAFYTYAFGCRAFNVACGFSLCLLKLLRTFHLSFVRWAFVDCFVFHMPLCTEAGFAHLRTGAGLVYTLLLSASTLSDWAPINKKGLLVICSSEIQTFIGCYF